MIHTLTCASRVRPQVLAYQSTDATLKTLQQLGKKQKEWLQLVISETRSLPLEEQAKRQAQVNSSDDAAQQPEVVAVQEKTKILMLKIDGHSCN